jgi:tetratricopeptide (TPR) repeat protein
VRTAIALALLLMSADAGAGPAEERAMALAVARRDGEQAMQRGDHAACAAAFLRAFDIDSRQIGDELLYNAGVCFEEDAEVDKALDTYQRMERGYPRSRLRSKSLARRANILARVARFEEAASALEQYAEQYGGERDAGDALSNAALYRRALGQNRRAIELARRWIKTYKHTPVEEAGLLLFVAAVQEEMGDRRAAIGTLESAARLARRDSDQASWIQRGLDRLKNPPRREKTAPLPERYDRGGVMADILWTAPLAP